MSLRVLSTALDKVVRDYLSDGEVTFEWRSE